MQNQEENNTLANMINQITTNFAQVSALKQLLVDKNILTEEEVAERFDKVFEEDSGNVYDFLETGEIKE
ncbi:hypothetical protein [Halobacillus sp. Marseille-P3879]|uniref:hypothetical protein n=1 Tax=Halobacillus TaxID=45667 RepID=UPI000C7AC612|nr:hypothetical protein [Halobacillus sp. Marseille-P3879]